MLNCLYEKIKGVKGQTKQSKLCFLITDFNKLFVTLTKTALKIHFTRRRQIGGVFNLKTANVQASVTRNKYVIKRE